MKKIAILLVLISASWFSISNASETLVEIMLKEPLDEPRGFCIDIAGGKGKGALIKNGLQAHTCYHYEGALAEDQAFDKKLLSKGEFFIPYYNVCMAVETVQAGSPLILKKCQKKENQQFTLKPNGELVPSSKPELCVTVDASHVKKGRGGNPIHIMRKLSLEPCSATQKKYQRWGLNSL